MFCWNVISRKEGGSSVFQRGGKKQPWKVIATCCFCGAIELYRPATYVLACVKSAANSCSNITALIKTCLKTGVSVERGSKKVT